MSLFGMGKSKQSSQQTSDSSSIGYGSSTSGSISGGTAIGGSTSNSNQTIAFEDFFNQLYGGAAGAAGSMNPSALTTTANTLFGAGSNFLSSLSGGPEQGYLEGRVAGTSPVLNEQVAGLSDDLGTFFREELNPAITSSSVTS